MGAFNSAVGARYPAQPVIALVDLLGILAGEQIPLCEIVVAERVGRLLCSVK